MMGDRFEVVKEEGLLEIWDSFYLWDRSECIGVFNTEEAAWEYAKKMECYEADIVDGYNRDDLGESPDY